MEYNIFTISVDGFFKKTYIVHKNDKLLYTARPRGFFSQSYHLYNTQDQLVLDINYKFNPFNLRVEIIDSDGLAGTIKKKTFANTFIIESYNGDYRIEGNFWSTNFDVFHNENQIAKVSRKKFTNNKAYGMAVIEGVDEDFVVSLLLSTIIIREVRKKS